MSTDHTLAATGVFVHLAGWIWGAAALARLIVRHPSPIAGYAVTLLLFMATGMLGSVVFALSIGAAAYEYVAYSLHSAVWFFLLPIFLGVSTRMVPFFSSRVLGAEVNYRPAWARPALIAGAVAHGMLELAGAHALLWLVDFPMAIVIARLAVAWGLPRSLRVRLLAVLHISLGVLSAVFLLYAALSLAVVAGEASRIGLAPLHLLVIGFFATMLLGMVSRVSLGHSGRALEADPLTWGCYLGLLTAAALRVAAEFSLGTSAGAGFMLGAAAAWLVSFGVWACRYIPMYVSPRVDARERR